MPEIAVLSDPNSPLRIEYSRAAMQQIRERAIDGLMALPRIGMGVGGILLGARRNGVIAILDSVEIPCAHSGGPSFNLTAEEKLHVAGLISGQGDREVIGWYCTRTRGALSLGDDGIALYNELFPGPDQICMVMRPSTVEPVRAAFFCRDAGGRVVKAIECVVDEWRPPESEAEAEAPETPAIPAPQPVVPEAPPRPIELPSTPPAAVAKQRRRSSWFLGAAACLILAAAALLTRNLWDPRPPLSLTSTASQGTLTIRWNGDAFRGIDHASLQLNDGGNLHSVPLDRADLIRGVYIYMPKSSRVSAKLSAGDISGIAVWFAPPPADANR